MVPFWKVLGQVRQPQKGVFPRISAGATTVTCRTLSERSNSDYLMALSINRWTDPRRAVVKRICPQAMGAKPAGCCSIDGSKPARSTNPFVRPPPFRLNTSFVASVFLDQVGGGFLSQLRVAIRVNPQSSSMSSFSFCSGGAQPK